MLHLIGGGLEVMLVGRLHFDSGGVHLNALAAIEADVVDVDDGGLLDDGAVLVNVGDMHAAEVRARAVVGEYSATPLAAGEADAAETEAVVHATVEPNMRAPIAGVPAVGSAFKTPVARSPQQASAGRLRPHARNPEVSCIPVRPVAGSPEITRRRQI